MHMKTIKDLCIEYGFSQAGLSRHFGIPPRTVQDWYSARRTPPDYVVRMMDKLLELERLQFDNENR